MIVRVQFIEAVSRKVIQSWSLFKADESWSLAVLYTKIKNGEVSCGRELVSQLRSYDNVSASTFSSNKVPSLGDLMDTPMVFSLRDLSLGHQSIFIEYVCTSICEEASASTSEVSFEQAPVVTDSITDVLINRSNHYVSPKPDSKKGNVKQYNALVNLTREKKFGVRGSNLVDFQTLLNEFASLLWTLDPHFEALRNRGCANFHNLVVKQLLGFNDPKKHGHKVDPLNGAQIEQQLISLEIKLDRKYFDSSHLKPFYDIVRSVLDNTMKYLQYKESDRERVKECHKKESPECTIDDFKVTEIVQKFLSPCPYVEKVRNLRDHLKSCDTYTPVEIKSFVPCENKKSIFNLSTISKIRVFLKFQMMLISFILNYLLKAHTLQFIFYGKRRGSIS